MRRNSGTLKPGRGEVLVACCFFEAGYLIGLWAFGALNNVELDLIAFFKALIPLALDGAVMNEDIGAIIAAEESVPFCVVEPLHCSLVLCQD
jgi:hypothetical protein